MAEGQFGFASTLDNAALLRQAEEAKGAFRDISKTASEESGKIDNAFKNIGKAVAGYFSVKAAADFGKQIVKVRGEIESLEVSFKTLLGDEKKAVALMADIRKFAASTPMQMNDLAAGAQTLLGFNIEAEKVMPTLQALGDISMGDSQKFNSLTLAFAQMSSTGKLMGQDLLQMINAGFNPLVQIAERTGKSVGELKEEMSQGKISVEMVTQAFMDATAEGGKFHGMLEKQSQGIQGSLSNVQGALNDMLNDLGEKIQEPVTDGLHLLQRLIQHYEEVGKVIGVLVATYGGYKAAVMAYNAAMVVATNLTKGYTVAQQIEYVWLLLVEKAQALLNKTMLKNPFILAATALIALISALVLLKKRTSEAEKAQNALNNAVDGSKKRSDDLKQEANDLIAVLDDETATEAQHKEALDKLIATYPELLKDCKTYNDYLEHRKAILEGMPKAQEEKENETLRESISLMEEYTKVKKDAFYKNGESYQQYDERINNDYGSYQKRYEKEIELRKKLEAGYQEWKEAGNKGTLDEYVRLSLEANKKVLNDRIKTQQQAAFEAKPIEERIEITETSIKQVEASITFLKRKAEAEPWNPVLQLDLSMAEQQLETLQNRLDNLTAQKPMPVKIDFGKAVRDAERALATARRNYRDDASETNRKAVTDAEAGVDTAKKNYKNAYGKDYDQAVKAGQDKLKEQKKADAALQEERKKYADWLIKQAQQEVFDRRQAEIDAMKDGLQKTLKQIELDYDRQLATISDREEEMVEKLRDLKEAEWNAANPDKKKKGESFDRSTVTVADLSAEQQQQITNATTRALDERHRKEKETLEATLREVETYTQQRLRIIEEFKRKQEALYEHDENGNRVQDADGNDVMISGASQGNIDELSRQQDEAMKSIDEQYAERSAAFQRWANELGNKTVLELRKMLEVAKKTLETLSNNPDADPKKLAEARAQVAKLEAEIEAAALTPKEEELEQWSKYADKLDEVGNAINSLGSQMEGTAGKVVQLVGSMFNAASTTIKSLSDLSKATMKGIEATAETTSAAAQAVTSSVAILAIISAIYTVIVKLRDAVDGWGENWQWLSDYLHNMTDNLTIMSVLTGGLSTIWDNTSGKARKHQGVLDGIEDQISGLDDSYDKLGKQAERTFGASNAEIRRQQIELKKAQIELLKTSIAEEEAEKDPDNDKINQWQSQINTITKEIADLGEEAVNAIYGEDIKSAIESFAEALTDAWAEGTNGAQTSSNIVRSMMKKMFAEVIKDAIASAGYIDQLRAMMSEMYRDGVISDRERARLEAEAERMVNEVQSRYGWMLDLFNDSDREGEKKGIATASQESVDENNGRLTFIQGAVTVMKEHTLNISENSNLIRDNVAAITSCLLRVETAINTIKTTLSDMQLQGVRIRS